MELAIINGTYRDSSKIQQKMNQILIPSNGALAAAAAAANSGLRSPPNQLGQPLIISPRLTNNAANNAALLANGGGAQLIASSTDPSTGQLIYTIPAIYSDHAAAFSAAAASQALLEYPNGIEFSQAGKFYRNNGNNIRNPSATLAHFTLPIAYKENNATFQYVQLNQGKEQQDQQLKQIQLAPSLSNFVFSASSPPLSTSSSSSSSLASSAASFPFHFSLFR